MHVEPDEKTLAVAKAIWRRRPDCIGKPWPVKPSLPVAARDLCIAYAEVAIATLATFDLFES